MVKASEVIKLAQSWIGKNESDGSFKEIIDIYNSQKTLPRGVRLNYANEWCAATISALAIKLGCTDIMPTECGCQKMIEKYKGIGCWQEDESITPKVGYIIFYDWQDNGKGNNTGWADHVGIVESVSNGKITIIEGNYNRKVARRTLEVNATKIRGYGMPKYEAEATVEAKPSTIVSTSNSEYYPKYTGNSPSLDTILEAIGVSAVYRGHWTRRKPLAVANGIPNYTGLSTENSTLKALARNGKLKKVSINTTVKEPTTTYYPKYTGKSISLNTILKSIGVPTQYIGNYKARIPLAEANGITNYTGTITQNSKLKSLAKSGKLKKV